MSRIRPALLLLLSLLLVLEVAGGLLRAPYMSWNVIRLFRSKAIVSGLPLYPGHSYLGPIIGTLHTPLSHLFYVPSALIPDPTAALVAGSLQAVLAVLIPLAWMLFRGQRPLAAAFGFFFAAFLIVQSPGTYHVLFMIHADAPAVGFATLACGLLIRAGDLRISHYWLAGAACALSLGAKQTMAPVVIGIAAYLLLAAGWRAMAHFLCAAAVSGALLLAMILTAWPARDVLFDIWTLASHRPLKPDALQILIAMYRETRLDALPALLPLLFIGFSTWRGSVRDFIVANRWVVFAFCGILMLPVSLKATATMGSDVNHLGVVLYFLFAAAALALEQQMAELSSRVFVAAGILVGIAPGLVLTLPSAWKNFRSNPLQTAIAYNQRHPGRAYFPWDPASAFAYHVDPALSDREIAGYPLTAEQVQTGLPKQFSIVAIPPGETLMSKALLDLTAAYRPIRDPELQGWTVLARP